MKRVMHLLLVLLLAVTMGGCSKTAKFNGTYVLTGFIQEGKSEVIPVGDSGNAGTTIDIKDDKFVFHLHNSTGVSDYDGILTDISVEIKDSNMRAVSFIQNGSTMGIGTFDAKEKHLIFSFPGGSDTVWVLEKK